MKGALPVENLNFDADKLLVGSPQFAALVIDYSICNINSKKCKK